MKSYQDLWEAEHAEKVALKQQTLAAFCSLRQAHKAQVDTLRGKLGALEEQLVDVGAACYAMQAWARRTEKQRQDLQEADRELYAELFDHYNNRYESINSGVR